MKKVRFTDKTVDVVKEVAVGNLGEKIFPLCKNVNEMNSIIRWCNSHKDGDVFENDLFKIELFNV